MSGNNLQSLRFSNNKNEGGPKLSVLDQLLIPAAKEYVNINTVEDAWSVIRSMQIRGAPLIAIVAVLGLAVDCNTHEKTLATLDGLDQADGDAIFAFFQEKLDYLATSRPTAVNLFNALEEVKGILLKVKDAPTKGNTVREAMCMATLEHAEYMLQRDVADNQAIGKYGAQAILRHSSEEKVRLMTICNTGSLATAGYGTALGVARALQATQNLESIAALETRPYNQGSRLTAFEMVEEQMPGAVLICDSAAAAYMSKHKPTAVVVGADRVCANGDTANKIGTFNLALVAAAHGVPFYVASPFTTLDLSLHSGDDITIEERPAQELIESSRAPQNVNCWNPAFDVTPAKYIAGIITEKGVVEPAVDGTMDVQAFVKNHTMTSPINSSSGDKPAHRKLHVPIEYTQQSIESLPLYLAKFAPDAMEALGATSASDLSCVEMGDGNLNLVFIVTNSQNDKKVVVKQSLPYVRCVGMSWPLTLDRSFFEYTALAAEKESCPEFVPSIYHFSRANSLIVMEYIPPPNIILRKGLVQGIRYPTMAEDMGIFCAKTLFKTSGFKLSETELRNKVEFWCANKEMCALTEQVVFTEPYVSAPNNRWTSPQLDADKVAIETDVELKVAAAELKVKFVTETQALIHADLHTGSVMCSPEPHQTYVIDPEFAFYGPMGFDLGAFIGNLFLAYASQGGHDNDSSYDEWILHQIEVFWTNFTREFLSLWSDTHEHTGMKYQRSLLSGAEELKRAEESFVKNVLRDTLGFCGMKMLRRIVGIAHVEDLESIEDPDVRARCERHGLEVAKIFIKTASSIESIQDAIDIARSKKPKT